MDLSEDDTTESESDSSMLDDDDDDDNLAGEQNSMSSQDHTATQLGRSSGGGGLGLGGASLRDRDNDDDSGGDIDLLKRRARLLHSQETHMEGRGSDGVGGGASGLGGASLMPKLELAEPEGRRREMGRLHRQWDDHPSSSTSSTSAILGVRHSLPLLSTNHASG